MEEQLKNAMNAIKGVKIPNLPKEVLELDEQLSSRFPNNQTITEIIQSNTKLSGEVLRIVNSPVIKTSHPIKTIREAVDVLGYTNLKNLVLASALQNLFNTAEVNEIIEHSKDVAFCCAELSELVQGVSRDEAYLVGLFHNAGSLLLASKDPEYVKLFARFNTHPISTLNQEMAQYGANHTFIGVLIGQKWRLSIEVLNAIMTHHMPCEQIKNDEVRAMVAMIKVSNVVVNEVSYDRFLSNESKQELQDGQQELMITDDQIQRVRKALMTTG
ncbi:HDOD domain-containing protein [Thiomicrospira sp. WB1]|uniref:HDOD domain-containing protein n=1 Tax=Thiomicrospira sp. WB1 TaxID=1685380 RepID=UPI000747497D|nr:HDOD domain-containing protein [Thiomicrospira sp. WB1]KUJ72646.1 signal transduction protein [Thiomicrospira sp. WB1]